MPDLQQPYFRRSASHTMFTGIITATGRITAVQALGASADFGVRVRVGVPDGYLDDVALGDSIAIQGACMTVVAFDAPAAWFAVDVSAESLDKTRGYAEGELVNLEKALRAQDRLGGHIVSGHVDAVGQVVTLEAVGESHLFTVRVPQDLAKYFAYKGSITVNGASLTVNHVQDHATGCDVAINLIPHTLTHTALGELQVGSPVNIEVDLIARYCERMLQGRLEP